MITSLLFSLFIIAILGLLIFDLFTVLLTYCIYWYEVSNSNTGLAKKRFSWRNLQRVIRLIIPEVFFDFITIAAIPVGLFRNKNQTLHRGQTPVLLLHGLFVNQSCWLWFRWQLRQQGIQNVTTMNLSSWHSEEALTELLAKRVDELRHQLGVNKIHLVGHSMGGIIARNYVQLRGGQDKVEKLICLGSPHYGSKLATFSLDPLGKLLIPDSDFLQRLNNAPKPEKTKVTNIYTNKDNMVLPNANNHLPWGEPVELKNMGHTSLIYRKAPITATIAALKRDIEPAT
ncbi:Triacylglycerol esterase/lipase EstA, alpha/beta hydrolase fold [Desulfuromusa kysingii]|uniref:Triacylglycerol esterase/lipase EstA, alpha/beta hydrolase fold n=1 Tax=Desulfuromusa kysingii TaxID=37625 RepID=A0A1H3WTQ0_9BACT|nr:alpha/beta fold hydrolase [Desulfuromusa kysingii]SDZ90509.1 Triacylglycerol esterase/lipase EstA, alpha/beta hydrolase fold [Desulfuromusa kysingii]